MLPREPDFTCFIGHPDLGVLLAFPGGKKTHTHETNKKCMFRSGKIKVRRERSAGFVSGEWLSAWPE